MLISDLNKYIFFGVESFAIIGLVLYLIFAIVVLRQVKLMTDTLEVGFEGPILAAAWFHLILALATLITAFLLL